MKTSRVSLIRTFAGLYDTAIAAHAKGLFRLNSYARSADARAAGFARPPSEIKLGGYQKSVGRRKAIALFTSNWWVGRPAREIAKFQLFTIELCMPFGIFHRALEESLGRSVWIHEFGLNVDGLIQEFLDERDPPTVDEILDLLPRGKPSMVFAGGSWADNEDRRQ